MQDSLEQNERSIILGSGQLAVAGRNAKIAEDTLDLETRKVEEGHETDVGILFASLHHGVNKYTEVHVQFQNSGKGRAGGLFFASELEFRNLPPPLLNSTEAKFVHYPGFVEPRGGISVAFIVKDSKKLSSATEDAFNHGRTDLYVWGLLKYENTFSGAKKGPVQFCISFSGKDPHGDWTELPWHNCAREQ
jgi:hypothetical protein